jgi:uncharacterized membrane protein YkgB
MLVRSHYCGKNLVLCVSYDASGPVTISMCLVVLAVLLIVPETWPRYSRFFSHTVQSTWGYNMVEDSLIMIASIVGVTSTLLLWLVF